MEWAKDNAEWHEMSLTAGYRDSEPLTQICQGGEPAMAEATPTKLTKLSALRTLNGTETHCSGTLSQAEQWQAKLRLDGLAKAS